MLGATPVVSRGSTALSLMATPSPASFLAAAGASQVAEGGSSAAAALLAAERLASTRTRWEREIEERNRPWTEEELDAILPGDTDGYVVVAAPANYRPLMTPLRKLMATPAMGGVAATPGGFVMTSTPAAADYGVAIPAAVARASGAVAAEELPADAAARADLPTIRPDEAHLFSALMEAPAEGESEDKRRARLIAELLLKIKNGTPPQRKTALKQLTTRARELGAGPIFNQILPLMMAPSIEDHERHLLVKVIDRVLYRLDDLVRPYVHKILSVVGPLLLDADYYARVEGREVIANLAKAAGLTTMIAAMRPDVEDPEESTRNLCARAFAVVASALGVQAMLPFLRAVCASKKSWMARHTGVKIVQQLAILMGSAVLPHLKDLVSIVGPSLQDEQLTCRMMSALALAALAEASHPYGIESFDSVVRPLWQGVTLHRGKSLAAFLKAIGFIIPLMDATYAAYATRQVMPTVMREFKTPDEETRRIVLKVLQQCVATDGVTADFVRSDILTEFFQAFWVRRMALDRRGAKAVIDTTVELANKVGGAEILARLADDLKDESEPYRRMVMACIDRIVANLGVADVPTRLEETLIDGIIYAFQEQGLESAAAALEDASVNQEGEGRVVLRGFSTVMTALGERAKPYLSQISAVIKWRLNMKSAPARAQAADLCARVAPIMQTCHEHERLAHLGTVLYECLGEEYPDVLGAILGALSAIVAVIDIEVLQPPVSDLLPRLTPILRNVHEKVQENCIDLVGRIADRAASAVPNAEWMRVCFLLIDLLRAPRKAIRRATVNTFSYIAKAIGPQDVLVTLLNNLRVADRTSRVCSTVAIAIVAETCQPFTVVPALMTEYRVPEVNVQNGVLKALSFLFEYIGEVARDYVYAITPLVEDALTDRDIVHRQTACSIVKHLALGVRGFGREDSLLHLLNFVWPNIFETSPHVLGAVFDAVEGLRVGLGPQHILQYLLAGLFHPARRVREVCWQLYNNLYVYAQESLLPFYPRIPALAGSRAAIEAAKVSAPLVLSSQARSAAAAASSSSSAAAAASSASDMLTDTERTKAAASAGVSRIGEAESTSDLSARMWRSSYRRSYLDVIV